MLSTTQKVLLGLTLPLAGLAFYLWYRAVDDEDDSHVVTRASQTVIHVDVPRDCVGAVIGSGGSVIRKLQDDTSTKIHFVDERSGDGPNDARVIRIRGRLVACQTAEMMIRHIIETKPVVVTETMVVPQSAVGGIIGRGGSNIRAIQQHTRVKVDIGRESENRDTAICVITLKGVQGAVDMARDMITEKVHENSEFMEKRQQRERDEERLRSVESAEKQRVEIDNAISQMPKCDERVSTVPAPRTQSSFIDESSDDSDSDIMLRSSPPPSVSGTQPPTAPISLSDPRVKFETWPWTREDVSVYVTALIDPHRFWVQIIQPSSKRLEAFQQGLFVAYSTSPTLKDHKDIPSDSLLAAPFPGEAEDKLHRVQVLPQEDKGSLVVKYLDYGDDNALPQDSDLRSLRSEHLAYPLQAIEVRLGGVSVEGEGWSDAAVESFEEITECARFSRPLIARTLGKHVNADGKVIPVIELLQKDSATTLNIGGELIALGFARSSGATSDSSSSPPGTPRESQPGDGACGSGNQPEGQTTSGRAAAGTHPPSAESPGAPTVNIFPATPGSSFHSIPDSTPVATHTRPADANTRGRQYRIRFSDSPPCSSKSDVLYRGDSERPSVCVQDLAPPLNIPETSLVSSACTPSPQEKARSSLICQQPADESVTTLSVISVGNDSVLDVTVDRAERILVSGESCDGSLVDIENITVDERLPSEKALLIEAGHFVGSRQSSKSSLPAVEKEDCDQSSIKAKALDATHDKQDESLHHEEGAMVGLVTPAENGHDVSSDKQSEIVDELSEGSSQSMSVEGANNLSANGDDEAPEMAVVHEQYPGTPLTTFEEKHNAPNSIERGPLNSTECEPGDSNALACEDSFGGGTPSRNLKVSPLSKMQPLAFCRHSLSDIYEMSKEDKDSVVLEGSVLRKLCNGESLTLGTREGVAVLSNVDTDGNDYSGEFQDDSLSASANLNSFLTCASTDLLSSDGDILKSSIVPVLHASEIVSNRRGDQSAVLSGMDYTVDDVGKSFDLSVIKSADVTGSSSEPYGAAEGGSLGCDSQSSDNHTSVCGDEELSGAVKSAAEGDVSASFLFNESDIFNTPPDPLSQSAVVCHPASEEPGHAHVKLFADIAEASADHAVSSDLGHSAVSSMHLANHIDSHPSNPEFYRLCAVSPHQSFDVNSSASTAFPHSISVSRELPSAVESSADSFDSDVDIVESINALSACVPEDGIAADVSSAHLDVSSPDHEALEDNSLPTVTTKSYESNGAVAVTSDAPDLEDMELQERLATEFAQQLTVSLAPATCERTEAICVNQPSPTLTFDPIAKVSGLDSSQAGGEGDEKRADSLGGESVAPVPDRSDRSSPCGSSPGNQQSLSAAAPIADLKTPDILALSATHEVKSRRTSFYMTPVTAADGRSPHDNSPAATRHLIASKRLLGDFRSADVRVCRMRPPAHSTPTSSLHPRTPPSSETDRRRVSSSPKMASSATSASTVESVAYEGGECEISNVLPHPGPQAELESQDRVADNVDGSSASSQSFSGSIISIASGFTAAHQLSADGVTSSYVSEAYEAAASHVAESSLSEALDVAGENVAVISEPEVSSCDVISLDASAAVSASSFVAADGSSGSSALILNSMGESATSALEGVKASMQRRSNDSLNALSISTIQAESCTDTVLDGLHSPSSSSLFYSAAPSCANSEIEASSFESCRTESDFLIAAENLAIAGDKLAAPGDRSATLLGCSSGVSTCSEALNSSSRPGHSGVAKQSVLSVSNTNNNNNSALLPSDSYNDCGDSITCNLFTSANVFSVSQQEDSIGKYECSLLADSYVLDCERKPKVGADNTADASLFGLADCSAMESSDALLAVGGSVMSVSDVSACEEVMLVATAEADENSPPIEEGVQNSLSPLSVLSKPVVDHAHAQSLPKRSYRSVLCDMNNVPSV